MNPQEMFGIEPEITFDCPPVTEALKEFFSPQTEAKGDIGSMTQWGVNQGVLTGVCIALEALVKAEMLTPEQAGMVIARKPEPTTESKEVRRG